jgi:adenylate cyclase
MPKPPKSWRRYFNWGALVGVLVTVFSARVLMLGSLQDENLGARFIYSSYDLPFGFRKHIPAAEAVIVYMDEESHRELKQAAHQAWSRKLHAQLIRKLTAEGANVIAIDSTFLQPGDPNEDKELADAMMAHGKVVFAADLELGTTESTLQNRRVSLLGLNVFGKEGFGAVVNLDPDPGMIVRHAFKMPPDLGIEAPLFADKVAELGGFAVSERSRDADWLNYYGPSEHISWASYHRALGTNGTTPDFFKNKVVFIGQRTQVGVPFEEREDYNTPFTRWDGRRMSGVEIHATRFLNLIHGTGLRRLSSTSEAVIIGMLGIALGWGLILVRPTIAVLLSIAAAVTVIGLSYFLFKSALVWWAWGIVVGVQIPIALAWAVTFNTVRLKIESKVLERSIELHLSPKHVKLLRTQPELLQPGGQKHEISILFTDIANFSSITARMHPADLFKLLNNYFETTLSCIHKTDGTVVKLIGDAIFAIWNAPFLQENHAKLAVQTALAMRDQLVRFDAAQQSLPLQTRIGLHLGDAFVGNVGSQRRFDYTAIGDSINMASRLEGLNKHLGTTVLATRDIQRLVENEFSSRLIGHFVFKGIERAVEVHEFIAPGSEQPAWKAIFAEALFNFQRRNFEAAATGFRNTIQVRGKDGPSEFYLEQIDKISKSELPESWAGEVRLSDK